MLLRGLNVASTIINELRTRWTATELLRVEKLLLENRIASGALPTYLHGEDTLVDLRGYVLSQMIHNLQCKFVDLSYMSLFHAGQFDYCTFENCYFIAIEFHANLGSKFYNCNFTSAKLQKTVLRGEFSRCDFINANLSGVLASQARFSHCRFDNCNLRSAAFYNCIFDNCSFSAAKFGKGSIANSKFTGNRPDDASLLDTVCEGAIFK